MNEYVISVGQSRTSREWKNKSTTWAGFVDRLRQVKRTLETAADYKAMTKIQRGKVKDIGGFVGGVVEGGRRKADTVTARSLVTLDIDYGKPDTPEVVRDMLAGTAWCLYPTHSHTAAAPRYRLVIPLSREVSPEEYIPIARRVADDIGIDVFDSSTYEPSRLMYWPSVPADVEYRLLEGTGEPLDADRILASYTDWRNVAEWPVDSRTSQIAQGKPGAKQEDPTAKPGVIGAFCRCYGITEAIETFLPGVYTPTGHEDRWTYAQGSTEGGLVVYEDKWAYSHHGTDPCCAKLVNAFDLVRIHLFGKEDQDADINTPVNRLPSFAAMERTAREDGKVSKMLLAEHFKGIGDDFGDLLQDDGFKTILELMKDQVDAKGKPLPVPYNFGVICRYDKRLAGACVTDLFLGRPVLTRDLPWRPMERDPYWNNSDDASLIDYVSHYYRMQGKTALLDAMDAATAQHTVHPVRDYLKTLEWDGTPRLDTLLCDYLGAADTPLTRAMTRKHFCAAVARVMRPGCKYDYVLTLIGPEGSGKSTLVRLMALDKWFTDSLTSIEGKEAMEQLRGKWLVEMGELTNYKKSTSEAYKAFISKQDDSYRPAYGRKSETYPRQCVFFATTNERAFLKGDTGNRRFWVVECGVRPATKNPWEDLPDEVGQIWAEAQARWRQGEQLFLDKKMEADARALQEGHNEVAADERAGLIEAFLRQDLPSTWANLTMQQRADWFKTASAMDHDGDVRHRRETVCAVEILVECFGEKMDKNTRYKTREINQILCSFDFLKDIGRTREPVYGLQRRFRILYDEDVQ